MEPSPFELSGFLEQFPLVDVVQLIGMSQKTGELRLASREADIQASLFFRDGQLLHATYNDEGGTEAAEKILSLEEGFFKFVTHQLPAQISINKPVHFVLLESQRRSDELKNLSEKLPPDDTVLFICPDLDHIPALNTREWKVISLINGRRTIRRICHRLGDELGTKQILHYLIQNRLVTSDSDQNEWEKIVPRPRSYEPIHTERPYPPLLRTNLLLKAIDGTTDLGQLKKTLRLSDTDLIEDLKLLFDTRWITFNPEDAKIFERIRHEL